MWFEELILASRALEFRVRMQEGVTKLLAGRAEVLERSREP